MLIGIFNSTLEAKTWIGDTVPETGDRIICLGSEQTSYERNGFKWMNINGIHIIGEKGQDGLDGKHGKNAQEVDTLALFNKVYETLKLDQGFMKKCKGEKGDSIKGDKGDPGKDCKIDLNEVIEILIKRLVDDKDFVEKCRGEKGKDGYSPVKGKDYFDGKDGEPKDGEDGIDGQDGWKVVLIEDPSNIDIKENQLGIDLNKNLYILHNNSILQL